MKVGTLEIELITNVARLQKEMGDMKRSVAGAMGDVAASAGRADRALASVGNGGLTRMGGSAKLAGHQMQNLVYQLNDVVVSLFSGQKPMTVFMQQGSQIGQIGMQAGVGIWGMTRALLGLAAAGAMVALTNPILLATAAAAALAFGAFKMFQSSVKQSGELERYVASLGLTKKQMKELGPVGITAGDSIKGLWKTISDGLNLGSVFSTLSGWASTAFGAILTAGKSAAAGICAFFAGTFASIQSIWSALPGVIGEATTGAANLAITSMEWLINKAITGLNWLTNKVNPILKQAGISAFKAINDVDLKPMENKFAGAAANMGKHVRDDIAAAFGDAMSGMDAFGTKWSKNTIDAAKARMAAKAAEIKSDKADKTPTITEFEKALKAAREFAASLMLETAKIGKTSIEIKRLEVGMEALAAPTDEAALAIIEAGKAWEEATKKFAASEFTRNTIVPLELQIALLGKSTKAKALANLEAEKEQIVLERGAGAWDRYNAAKQQLIEYDFGIEQQEAYLAGLDEMASQTQRAAQGMADAFGSVGGAIGAVAVEITKFAADQVAAAQRVADAERAHGKTSMQYADARTAQSAAEINHYGNLASAAQGFFKQGSKGFKVLGAAEKAFRAFELAIAIKSAAVKLGLIGAGTAAAVTGAAVEVGAVAAAETAKTGLTVAGAAVRTPLKVAEGAASMFAALGPWGFAAVAAMLALMAALGFSGGGGASKPPPTNDGTGTVFGDGEAKSESIAKAIDHLREIDTLTMRYSAAMLASLRGIEANIGGLTNLIIRTNGGEALAASIRTGTQVTGALGVLTGSMTAVTDFLSGKIGSKIAAAVGLAVMGPLGAALGFIGAKVVGFLGSVVGGITKFLFGTKTSVIGQGISGGPQALGDINAGGFDAQYFADIKKVSHFLGVKSGTSYSTEFSDAGDELNRQFSLIFKGFYDAISAAAGPLGLSLGEVQSRLDSFVVDIGKIDLKGLTGQEIQEKLTAVFGAAADNLARSVVPGLEAFQKVGEGYFETLVRVASSVEAVTSALTMLGHAADLTIVASMNLVDMFGSVSDMISATSEYFSLYYTNAEQAGARTAQLAGALAGLGLTMPSSIAGYRALVEAQDLTTEAGRAAYVALIQLAPAFADLAGAAQDAASAAAIADERLSLQRRMLELQGDTAALRALDLAQLDASNRALQRQIWALEDQQKAAADAAAAAEKLSAAWAQVTDGLIAEIKRIRGIMGSEPTNYAAALAAFNSASMLARGGDQEAAKLLPGLSQALLAVAANTANSSEDLARLQGLTAASLEQTLAIINPASGGTVGWLDQLAANQNPAATAANDSQTALIDELRGLRHEVSELRNEQRIASATIASGTTRTARILERVAPDGDAMATRVAA